MKKYTLATIFLFISCICFAQAQPIIEGAWEWKNGDVIQTAVFTDGYFSQSVFDIKNKKFISTRGGNYNLSDNKIYIDWQYDTEKAAAKTIPDEWLGKRSSFDYNLNKQLLTNLSGSLEKWTRTDDNQSPMAGVWRITGRRQGNDMGSIELRDRRTLKILTGKRFQWVAINIKTGEFSGTGGGIYTFKDGKYTERIEFFSRNNSRAGALLSFNGKIEKGQWHHSGMSSSGEPIYEIWSKLEKE